ncbi:MAG: transporter-related protein [Acidobacteria bacterium]|nr:transporter-related protein [Acidobacteriota bacterium]
MIDATNLSRVYRLGGQEVRALDGVDLAVGDRDFVAIVGASGSGKTTLLNLLAGLDRPTAGEILTPDGPLGEMTPKRLARYRRERVGMVFQTFQLIPHLAARQNVEMALMFGGVPRAERERRALEALERVGLAARAHHRPADLSGGEQQRVALARALVKDPSLLLADEPTGNLDRENAERIAEWMVEWHRQGRSVLLVTHDAALAARCAQRVVRLRYGQVVAVEAGGGAS